MIKIRTNCVLAILVLGAVSVFWQSTAIAQGEDDLIETAIQRAVEQVAPSVVQITTVGGVDTVNGVQTNMGPTTGVIVSEQGHIVSSLFNFVQKPASIFVRLHDGSRHVATQIGADKTRNLVLLKIETNRPLIHGNFLERGRVQVGQTAIAIGRGIESNAPSISVGIVSATHRIWDRAIQTDAKISPINFGGPLIDLAGNVLGILSPMSPDQQSEIAGLEWYDSGIGFAVPLKDLQKLVQDWTARPDREAGRLGILLDGSDIYSDPAKISAFVGVSPLARAGVKVGDTITKINARTIVRQSQLKHALGPLYRGEKVTVEVERDGKSTVVTVDLIGEVNSFLHRQIGILPAQTTDDERLIVQSVVDDSSAARDGIQSGDVLLSVDGQEVKSWQQVRQYLVNLDVGQKFELSLERDLKNVTQTVTVSELLRPAPLLAGNTRFSLPPAAATESLPVKVPEAANKAFAIVPESRLPASLLVWVAEPGATDRKFYEKIWKQVCLNRNLAVLVIMPRNQNRWNSEEIETIVTATDTLMKKIDVVPQRIAIGGTATGGALAAMCGARSPNLFTGIVLLNSGIPSRISRLRNHPSFRQMYLFGMTGEYSERSRVESDTGRLKNLNQPFWISDVNDLASPETVDMIARWIAGLDRL